MFVWLKYRELWSLKLVEDWRWEGAIMTLQSTNASELATDKARAHWGGH